MLPETRETAVKLVHLLNDWVTNSAPHYYVVVPDRSRIPLIFDYNFPRQSNEDIDRCLALIPEGEPRGSDGGILCQCTIDARLNGREELLVPIAAWIHSDHVVFHSIETQRYYPTTPTFLEDLRKELPKICPKRILLN